MAGDVIEVTVPLTLSPGEGSGGALTVDGVAPGLDGNVVLDAATQSQLQALQGLLATLSSDSTVVHKTGDETISGTKNFTGILLKGGTAVIIEGDPRLTNARTPIPHKQTHAANGVDAISPADIGALATTERAAPGGVATLGLDGRIPSNQLPAIALTNSFVVSSSNAMLQLPAHTGDLAIRVDPQPPDNHPLNQTYILQGSDPTILANWLQVPTSGAVSSVQGRTGVVDLSDLFAGLNDARFTDQRVPVAQSVTISKIDPSLLDPAANVAGLRTLGPGPQQAAPGNDSRFTNQRVPTDGSVSMAKLGSDVVAAFDPAGAAASALATANTYAQPHTTGLDALSVLVTTAFGRDFLTLPNVAAAFGKLGLGTAAGSNAGDFDAAGAASAALATATGRAAAFALALGG